MSKTVYCSCGLKPQIGHSEDGGIYLVCKPCSKVTDVNAYTSAFRKQHFNDVMNKHNIKDEPRKEISPEDEELLAMWVTRKDDSSSSKTQSS